MVQPVGTAKPNPVRSRSFVVLPFVVVEAESAPGRVPDQASVDPDCAYVVGRLGPENRFWTELAPNAVLNVVIPVAHVPTGPEFVQVRSPSRVVPPTVVFQVGEELPVFATWVGFKKANCMLPFGSLSQIVEMPVAGPE